MTKWLTLEDWLVETMPDGGSFTHADVVSHFGVSGAEASRMVQSYLRAQRSEDSQTLYVLHRENRTAAAVWTAGVRTIDARQTSGQFFDDVAYRWIAAVTPDLRRIAAINPRAARKCRQIIRAVSEGAMTVLQVAVDGEIEGDEDGASS